MQPSQQELRFQFEGQTDIVIDQKTKDWKKYALWLEKLKIKKLNNELVKENNQLRATVYEILDILERGVTQA
ncbi:hypothetical protein HOC37_05845 [bacterium]|jgi:hypothetical protein|nr:hypothetical protein [bacterium]MBT3581794.1 hypothetical protein [bacterium]MBT4552484.1 hypothetical protein [bacterium]